MPLVMRRVVTGHDEHGKAIVLIDGEAANRRPSPSGNASTLMWCSDATPAGIGLGRDVEDMGARVLGTPPPAHGTRFTVNEIVPGAAATMHRTESLDYVIVLSGEVEMDLDDSTVKLSAGDVLIQRGTNHAWVNRGTETARVAFVLIDAQPLGIGHPVVRGTKLS
jgi:quercetin dioxygenase-like cupin family protein